MFDEIYVTAGIVTADVVRVDGVCYRRVGPSDHDPTIRRSGVEAGYRDCGCETGSLQGMSHSMESDTQQTWMFDRWLPMDYDDAYGEEAQRCGTLHGQNHAMSSALQDAWLFDLWRVVTSDDQWPGGAAEATGGTLPGQDYSTASDLQNAWTLDRWIAFDYGAE